MVDSRRASGAVVLAVLAGITVAVSGALPTGVSLKPSTLPTSRPATELKSVGRPAGTAPPATAPTVRPSTTSRSAQASAPATQPVVTKRVEPLPSFAEPAISPDGAEIAFVSGGDIWTVPASGGEARLLVSHPGNESRPRYSPDGYRLAFVSNRSGNGDIYLLSFDSGELKRLTFDDGREELDGWSRDGKWIYFSTTAHDVGGTPDIYRVSAEGGTPMPVLADAYAAEYHAAPSPDGKQLVFVAGGSGGRNWSRRGHDHSDECDLWLMTDASGGAAKSDFHRLTEPGDKNLWPMWMPDGQSVYYVSDHGGQQNVWVRPADARQGGGARPVTNFKIGRVLFPDITPDGRTIVFERDFGLWKLDTASGKASKIATHLRGAPAAPGVEHFNYGSSLSDMVLSPDGKKVAFVAHGEVFAASSHDGGEAVRITQTNAVESHVVWSRDSRRLVYVSNRDGPRHLYLYDFSMAREYRITSGKGDDTSPIFAPEDDRLAFQRDGKDLMVVDIYSRHETLLAGGQGFDRPPFDRSPSPFAWSPKGDWIAFISTGPKGFDNVYMISTSTATTRPFGSVWSFGRGDRTKPIPHQITFMANAGSNAVSWSPDGTFLLFGTGQRTEEYQMARVDLIQRTPRFREDVFRDLFREVPRTTLPGRRVPPTIPDPRPPAPSTLPATTQPGATSNPVATTQNVPPKIVFEDIRQRLTLLPINADVGYQVISPDGKTVLFTATAANQQNLYTYSLDDSARDAAPRQLTSTGGYKHSAQFSPDGREVFYIDGGRLHVVPLDTRIPRQVGIAAEMDVDFAAEKTEVFHQAWQYFHDNFFDPHFRGLDWDAVQETYAPRVAGARTPDELRRLLSLMVGELNCSHVGAYGPNTTRYSTARLGISFDRAEYEKSDRLRVTSVVPLGPAAIAGIKPSDYIVGVNRVHVTRHVNLDEVLDQKIGKRVTLIVTDREGHNARDVAVLATDFNTERTLLYRAWVESRRQYVDRVSGGRLGYLHIPDMTESALARMNIDLDSENQTRDGIVIDIRNNHGGFVNGFAIDIFARRNYLTMTRRGFPPVAARTMLGQRAAGAPAVLVTNRFTISDAEDFTEGFRFLKLGKVVGEPTAGAVVFTSNVTLIDGTTFRIPETLVSDNTGTPLEMHPRPVDVAVSRTIGDGGNDRDIELDTAVAELLKQLSTGTSKPFISSSPDATPAQTADRKRSAD